MGKIDTCNVCGNPLTTDDYNDFYCEFCDNEVHKNFYKHKKQKEGEVKNDDRQRRKHNKGKV